MGSQLLQNRDHDPFFLSQQSQKKVLNIDLLICLAGVPLLGVSLRAMLAGMETMLDYGMMADWDIVQREFERARHHLAVPGPEYLVPQGREPSK